MRPDHPAREWSADASALRNAPAAIQLAEATAPLLVRRTRLLMWLMLVTGIGFTSVELLTAPALGPHTVVKGFGLLAMSTGLLILYRPAAIAHIRGLALLAVSGGYFATALSGALSPSREYATSSTLFVAASLTTATLLPWGAGAQAISVIVGAICLAMSVLWADGTLSLAPTDPEVAVALSFAASVAVAHEMQSSRRSALRLDLLRRRAEAEVLGLNASLEQRVVDRTADLSRINARLQDEIQERRRISDALSESRQRLVDVVDHSSALISLKDTAGRYLLVNREFERVLRTPRQSTIGRNDLQVFGSDRGAAESTRDRDVLAADKPLSFDDELAAPDGPCPYVTVKFPLRNAEGKAYGVGTISTDIARLRRAEAQARQHQEELAHVQRLHLVNQMAAVLAHEIHQPLGAIANYAQGGAHRVRAGNADMAELLPVLDKISAEALRAGGILRGVRGLMAKQHAAAEGVDVNAMVTDAARMLELQARRHDVELHIATTPSRPYVIADKTQIEQVLVNLVLNGIDAAASVAGERQVAVDTEVKETTVAITVRDSGPGVAGEARRRLFSPFFTTKTHGLGMGLAISRSIVEAHGGKLTLDADTGGGAVFRVALPLAAPVADSGDALRSVQLRSKATRAVETAPARQRQS